MLKSSYNPPNMAVAHRTPSHIVLATDFTARCDRAQDRAVQLALEWNASLTAIHVIESAGFAALPSIKLGQRAAAQRHAESLREEFAGVVGLRGSVYVETGSPDAVVQSLAARERADLIVTGLARNMAPAALVMGSTIDALSRTSSVPVLVVKKRVVDTRARTLVASDLSEASRAALLVASGWFPDSDHGLFHAFDPPYRMLVDDKAEYVRRSKSFAVDECRRFIVDTAGARAKDDFKVTVRFGDAVNTLCPLVDIGGVDLVIAGTHGRTGVMNLLLGSVASRIVKEVQSDVLIVPARFQNGVS
ncbi:universal stress protein [Neorhizobium tomejilense]|uniref:universal stress protein n=1 Tax=Neorhizobium tomejilense TaxID=2093828 RepID=UPI003ECF19A4